MAESNYFLQSLNPKEWYLADHDDNVVMMISPPWSLVLRCRCWLLVAILLVVLLGLLWAFFGLSLGLPLFLFGVSRRKVLVRHSMFDLLYRQFLVLQRHGDEVYLGVSHACTHFGLKAH